MHPSAYPQSKWNCRCPPEFWESAPFPQAPALNYGAGNWARRPKTGSNKGMLILLNEEEKMNIEKAAAMEGVSMSRFIVERP